MVEINRNIGRVLEGCAKLFLDPNYATFEVIGSMFIVFCGPQSSLCVQILTNRDFNMGMFLNVLQNDSTYRDYFYDVTFNPFYSKYRTAILDMVPEIAQCVVWKGTPTSGEVVVRNMSDDIEATECLYVNA